MKIAKKALKLASASGSGKAASSAKPDNNENMEERFKDIRNFEEYLTRNSDHYRRPPLLLQTASIIYAFSFSGDRP